MPGAATNTAKPDHLHFSNLKCGRTKAKANVLCSFMWCCHFLLFLSSFFFFLSCIAANTGDQRKRSSVPMNHDFKAVIICYFCQHLLWRLKVTFPPRVNIIVLNICCLWAILELFKRRTATSGQKDCLGFTVRKWLISKTSCLLYAWGMLLDYRKLSWTEHFWRNFSCLSGSLDFFFIP